MKKNNINYRWKEGNKIARGKIAVLCVILLALFMFSFNIGRYDGISLFDAFKIMLSQILPINVTWPPQIAKVILLIRFPRIFSAVLIGSALALSGASYQTVFKNPLVSPDILGASAGASLGAATAIFTGLGAPFIQILAFIFAIAAVCIASLIGNRVKRNPTLALILAGVFVSSFATAIVSMIKFMADPDDKLPAITFWLMGGLSNIKNSDILWAAVPIVAGSIPLLFLRWRMNVLSLGEDEARALGVETRKFRTIVIVCSTLLTSAAISIGGLIGWVGLIIPHLMRMLIGPNNSHLLPASAICGGAFLLLVDDFARSVAVTEIPLGVLTAIIGAPFFIFLITREKEGDR